MANHTASDTDALQARQRDFLDALLREYFHRRLGFVADGEWAPARGDDGLVQRQARGPADGRRPVQREKSYQDAGKRKHSAIFRAISVRRGTLTRPRCPVNSAFGKR